MFLAMRYSKRHLSFADQAALLVSRGMGAVQHELAESLEQAGYYRLSAYWFPFRSVHPVTGAREDFFQPGTAFSQVWNHYRFDRDLRLLFLDAIERIEVALRSQLAYLHTQGRDPFLYAHASYFPAWRNYMDKLEAMKNPTLTRKRTAADFVDHFFTKYGDCHDYLPLWMAVGVADFGFISFFYQHSPKSIRSQIAAAWGVKSEVLRSWLISLNTLRNTCAHHGRVWNKVWGTQPRVPLYADQPEWYMTYLDKAREWVRPLASAAPALDSAVFHSCSTGTLLYICKYLLSYIAPQSQWKARAERLFAEFAPLGIGIEHMGLSAHWQAHPLWK
ncbi:MAG: Abi family protein [Angelakisella sp.]